MPVAVAPTTPVQRYPASWLLPPAFCVARAVHVTEPPEATGVTVVGLVAMSVAHLTEMMSPACTSNAVDTFDVPVFQFVAGAAARTLVGGVATSVPPSDRLCEDEPHGCHVAV